MDSISLAKVAVFRFRRVLFRRTQLSALTVRASRSMDSRKERVFKELGLYSLRRNIEEIVGRVEEITPAALEFEEERKIKQEEIMKRSNLWDDLSGSDASLTDLADTSKVVDILKDLQYQAEEANLISELAEKDIVNYQLLVQAYEESLKSSKLLDYYEMSQFLKGPFDKQGACVTVKSESGNSSSQLWAERIVLMYAKWAEKHGWNMRIVENITLENCGVESATIEFESEYMYGYLYGEKGTHVMINGDSGSHEECWATVDVIPMFLDRAVDLQIDENEIDISSPNLENGNSRNNGVIIHHIPTGITLQSSGERSRFANKIKARNRLKAKLLVLTQELGISDINEITRALVQNELKHVTRYYMFRPQKLVRDLKTGMQIPDLNSVFDGNIEAIIRRNIILRHGGEIE
ncbi:hypothetical protein LUZ60_003622 [Juncus effusus]|nr:hypothetical protein LUZ60_003622 [Juncus effusus]